MATRALVLAWLDERGWPHDPADLSEDQDLELRRTLKICGHRNRRHEPCAFPPMANGRCKRAGGTSPKGIAHPSYRGKGRSKYLPGRIKTRYDELNAAGLLDLGHQLKLMAVREEMLLQRTDPAETSRTWRGIKQEWTGLRAALRSNDEGAVREHTLSLDALVTRGAADAEAWDELGKLWDLTRKVVDTEVKRRVMWRLFIKFEDAALDYDNLANAVRESVDEAVRKGTLDRKDGDRLLMEVSDRFANRVALPPLQGTTR